MDDEVTLLHLAARVMVATKDGPVDPELAAKLAEAVATTINTYKINPAFFWEGGYIGCRKAPLDDRDAFQGETMSVELP